VAVDESGAVYTGLARGVVLRLTDEGRTISTVADTGARPAGIELDADGTLIVCDSHRGLLRVQPETGRVQTLVSELAGRPLMFTNNASIAADGSVYFSDSSSKFSIHNYTGDLLEGRATGRLLRWSPDGEVEVILDRLRFANGVALSEDQSFALVAETAGYRVRKVHLQGSAAGQSEVLLDNLPGMPDNISLGADGVFWIAFPSTRNKLLDRLLPRAGALRRAVWSMPDRLSPQPAKVILVMGVTGDGTVRDVIFAPATSDFHQLTGVREHDGWLYLGSLVSSAIARIRRPAR
jgi:sugar lactone lactonase YvrE